MELLINGEKAALPDGLTLLQLLEQRGLDPKAIIAERNLELVPKDAFAATRLEDGDRLELLHFVGGG